MDSNTTSVIRDIFVIVAAGLLGILCLLLISVILKLYRPVKKTVHNSSKTTENLSRVSEDLAGISEETASNLARTSRNLAHITDDAQTRSEELSAAIHSVDEAAKNFSTAAAKVAELVSYLIPKGAGAGASTGTGSLLRMLRGLFGNQRSGDGGRTGRDRG